MAWGSEATIYFLVTKISSVSRIAIAGKRTVSIDTFLRPIHKARRRDTIVNDVITEYTSEVRETDAEIELHYINGAIIACSVST